MLRWKQQNPKASVASTALLLVVVVLDLQVVQCAFTVIAKKSSTDFSETMELLKCISKTVIASESVVHTMPCMSSMQGG